MSGLDPTVLVALIAASAAIVGAGLTLLGLFITRGTETRKLLASAPTGFAALVDELQEERGGLKAEIVRMAARDSARDEEMASMRSRMRGLEAAEDSNRRVIDALRLAYTDLRNYMRRAGVQPPPIPVGIGVEDSGEHAVVTGFLDKSVTVVVDHANKP